MAIFAERDPRFRGLTRNVLLFLLAAPLAIAALVAAVMLKQDRLKQLTDVYFFADSANGLTKGMAVRLIGFKIGSVADMTLEPNARVKVRMAINAEYTRMIPQDSTAHLTKEGLIGQSLIEIAPGADRVRRITQNSTLNFARARDMSEVVTELYDHVKPILADVKKITESINDPEGDVRQTIRNVNRVSASLADTGEQLKVLAKNANDKVNVIDGRIGAVHARVDRLLGQAGQGLETANRTLAGVEERVPGLMLRVEKNLDQLQSALADVKRITGEATEEAPPMLRDGRAVLEDTRTIVDGVKQSWPVRNMITAPVANPLGLDSYDLSPPAR